MPVQDKNHVFRINHLSYTDMYNIVYMKSSFTYIDQL